MTPGQVLQDVFGYTGFRPGQKEVVARLLQGKDCMCIMPTGGGKSLCYQVPAFTIFTDATLLDMCRQRPQTPQELRQVSGVGEGKLRRFGDAFLRVLTSRL